MIDRYPHTITVKEQPVSPGFDANGDPVAAPSGWSEPIPCRYETDGRSNIRVQKDGALKTYAFVVYLRLSDARTDYAGKVVRLYDADGTMVCEGLVEHSNAWQLSTVLFIERCL